MYSVGLHLIGIQQSTCSVLCRSDFVASGLDVAGLSQESAQWL